VNPPDEGSSAPLWRVSQKSLSTLCAPWRAPPRLDSVRVILIIAGPSGSGKSTVGALLAGRLHWTFADADTFHPLANIEKMRKGQPLTDADRWPWLRAIGAWMDERIAAGEAAVVTCSALRRAYRDLLLDGRPEARMMYLLVDREILTRHLAGRHGHFFPQDLLDSQLADQEIPHDENNVMVVTPEPGPQATAGKIMELCWPGGKC
jgi:gluconokinase